MDFTPIIIGLASFVIIGLFHPLVIWTEYYLSHKAWPLFLILGIIFCAISIFCYVNMILNTIFALIGFSSLWSIGELKHQKRRVEKGWFPKNPNRKIPYEK
jgi:uncharacterized membrane protein YuzA (DUF378 family)